jgi:hypothetical protein
MVFDAGGGGGRRTIERKFSRQGENFAYQNFLIVWPNQVNGFDLVLSFFEIA